MKLADSSAERDLYESLAEIYSIILTLDALEKAYLRDSIRESEYTETCDRLLRQYKSNLADESVATAFGGLEAFKAEWGVRLCNHFIKTALSFAKNLISSFQLEVPKATERLRIGLPATVETTPAVPARYSSQRSQGSNTPAGAGGGSIGGGVGGGGGNPGATHIVTASENFITLFDAVKMNMLSKDTLHPILVETIQAVNKVTDRDFDSKGKIVQWLITLNQMRAAEELNPEQARDLHFDLQAAYVGFKTTLQ